MSPRIRIEPSPCDCPSLAEVARAGLAGREVAPRCATHQADEIAALDADAVRAAAHDLLEREQHVLAELRARWAAIDEEADQARADTERAAWLESLAPIEATLARATGARPPIALNDDQALAAVIGAPLSTPNH